MDRDQIRQMAADSIANGQPTEWFERLYTVAGSDAEIVPWADEQPNPHLLSWSGDAHGVPNGGTALVVGCGLGDDAEELTRRGFQTTAFDISGSAIVWACRRFPNSSVDYVTADLFEPPAEWRAGFDFVFECYTVQALPLSLRAQAIAAIGELVRPDGYLLLVMRGRDASDDPGDLPWPITKEDLEPLSAHFETCSFEDFEDGEDPPIRRFRTLLRRRTA